MTTYTTFSVSPQPILVRRFKAGTFGQYAISQFPAFGFGQIKVWPMSKAGDVWRPKTSALDHPPMEIGV